MILLGMNGAGKTSFLYQLKLGEKINTIPTIGFNVETINYQKAELTLWDIGGHPKLKPLWRHYFAETNAVLYFVDYTQLGNIEEAYQDLKSLSAEPQLQNIPFLIVVNKFNG